MVKGHIGENMEITTNCNGSAIYISDKKSINNLWGIFIYTLDISCILAHTKGLIPQPIE